MSRKLRFDCNKEPYLVKSGFDVRNIKYFQLVQSQEGVVHDLVDGVACQVEGAEMMHRVPGRGRRRGQLVVAQVQVPHVGQVGQRIRGHEGQVVGGDVQHLQLG